MNALILEQVIEGIKRVLPKKKDVNGLHEPMFEGNEREYVKDCIDTGWVSSAGLYVSQFEEKMKEYTGIKHAIAVVNGTAALHMCLKLAGVKSGDEVLVPTLTFVATVNAIHYLGAIPHFIDSEQRSLGLNPHKLSDYLKETSTIKNGECFHTRTGRRIKAVIAMHTFGQPVDLDPLVEVCRYYQLQLIEDAAEALGSFYKGKHTGHWGKLAALSFNGNKIITTGGGGAILTNDTHMANKAKHLTTTARLPHRWAYVHDQVGYNYRLPNINAAIGCAQMEQIAEFVRRKRALAEKYRQVFSQIEGITFFTEPLYAQSNYWLNTLLLEPGYEHVRDQLLQTAHEQGIATRPAWTLMHQLAMNEQCPRMDLSTAESLEQRIINIPSSAVLGG